MTDLSSDATEIEAIADMAGELIHTKIEMAKRDTQMTHVLRVGTFHMCFVLTWVKVIYLSCPCIYIATDISHPVISAILFRDL